MIIKIEIRHHFLKNKANLWDLIAATGLVILHKIGFDFRPVTWKFDGWPWKTIGHLFYATPSFVHHLKTIGEFKLELQSGNAQFGSKSAIFCPMWPRNLMDDLENKANLRDLIAATGLVIFLKLDSNHRFFSPCDLEIWWMTPKNN